MKITDQENLTVHLGLADKLKDSRPRTLCPSCHADNWQLEKSVFFVAEFFAESQQKAACIPLLSRLCLNCCYVMFYNAMALGIKFPQPKVPELPADVIQLDDGVTQEVV